MKNPIKQVVIILAAALFIPAQAQQPAPAPAPPACLFCHLTQTPQASPPPAPNVGKNIRLAVLEPTGKGLADDDKWMLSLVQGSIYADFIKYSGMNVIDNQNIEKIYDEWEKSMSGNYSDADRVKIGNLTNASHILSGTVIKTPNAFMLELAVTDLQSGERKASYTQSVSAAALENHSAIKEASADLLKQLGVNLTSAALGELKQAANIARIQAEEAMARGIVAKRQGTEVAALSYFFQAAALDPSLAEAVNRSSVMAANVSSGNIGDDTRNDIVWRKSWVKRLEETEREIDRLNKTVSMPYTLYYSDEIIQGNINYQNETVSLTIKTNLHGRNSIRLWARSVEQALQAVYDGLEATKRKDTWNLRWPRNRVTNLKSFDRQGRNFTIVAELVNSRNQVIGSQELQVGGYWEYNTNGRPTLSLGYFNDGRTSASGQKDVVFKNVKADGITDNLTIRIASVNGEAAETAARKGVLQIKAMSKWEFDNNDRFTFAYGEIKSYKLNETVSGKNLIIPNTIWDDAVVISIGENAFSSKSLTGVTIPNSVTSIGSHAFSYNQLNEITIGENVRLGGYAFYNGFEEYYKNNGSRAARYRLLSSGGWGAMMTVEEQEEARQRIEKLQLGYQKSEDDKARQWREDVDAHRGQKQARPAVMANQSEASYNQIIKDYEKRGKNNSKIDRATVAEAYFMMGEIYYRKFEDIKLDAKNEKEMGNRVKTKTKALEDPAKYFAKVIEIGVEAWTMRATYMIGRGFYDMGEAVANQPLFGNEMEKMAGKIRVFSSLDKYYDKAMEYFGQNIAWAKEQNLKGEYIEMSMQAIMEMAYKRGEILEEVGLLFKNSPVPKGLSVKEKEYYVKQLDLKYREALDAAIPVYENGMKLAKDMGIANSPWVDNLRKKLALHKPNSEWKDVQIIEWKPAVRVK